MSIHVQTPDGKVLSWHDRQILQMTKEQNKKLVDLVMSGSPNVELKRELWDSPPFWYNEEERKRFYKDMKEEKDQDIDPYENTERGEE